MVASAKHDRTPAKGFNRDESDSINPFAGLRHRKASPRFFKFMTLNRSVIRQFISKVEWATATNICYLLSGRRNRREYAVVAAELNSMCKTRHPDIRLKKLHHEFHTCYALAANPKATVNHQHVEHDIKLRNCLGKYLYVCGHGLIEFLSLGTHADAMLTLTSGNLYFEFDSGHTGRGQLKDKIKAHYIGKGVFRVVFWTGTAEYAHWKNLATIKCLEKNRLNLLFEVARRIMKEKPNRILAAGYHEYLEDGKLYNLKGIVVWTKNGDANHVRKMPGGIGEKTPKREI